MFKNMNHKYLALTLALLLTCVPLVSILGVAAAADTYQPTPSMREVQGTPERTLPGYAPGSVNPAPSTPSAEAVRRTPENPAPAPAPAVNPPASTVTPVSPKVR